MKLEVNNFYRTRDNRKVEILRDDYKVNFHKVVGYIEGETWKETWTLKGGYITDTYQSEFDLILEDNMKIEVGKKYKTRDGKVAVITDIDDGAGTAYTCLGYIRNDGIEETWTDDGRYFLSMPEHELDIVGEWDE